jgi:hypothetical protein
MDMSRLIWVPLLFASACAPGPLPHPPLENVHQLAPGVLAGPGPHGEASFRELARLGVRTVISVDGAKPDVEAARRQGLRTVHLPIGYDGIPIGRALELGKALAELPGPLYVHCHHGKHRGPAAAAVACVVAGKLDNAGAVDVLRGRTGERYLGLWAAAREAKGVEPARLRALDVSFREIAPVPPLAEAMVALDGAFENLGLAAKAGWKTPPGHPDLDPAHEALRMREIFTEVSRTGDPGARPADYRAWMGAGLRAAAELESALRASRIDEAGAAFARLGRSCADCHESCRNARKK